MAGRDAERPRHSGDVDLTEVQPNVMIRIASIRSDDFTARQGSMG